MNDIKVILKNGKYKLVQLPKFKGYAIYDDFDCVKTLYDEDEERSTHIFYQYVKNQFSELDKKMVYIKRGECRFYTDDKDNKYTIFNIDNRIRVFKGFIREIVTPKSVANQFKTDGK